MPEDRAVIDHPSEHTGPSEHLATTGRSPIPPSNGDANPFAHPLRVRYGECDQQGVVFNANYLAYVDDAIDLWFEQAIGRFSEIGFDCMVKKATIEWSAPAKWGDELVLRPTVSRWGSTSFDITVHGTVRGQSIFVATLVYISVSPGTHEPCPTPDTVRRALR